MERDKHYLRVGVFVLLTLVAGAFFSVWLAGKNNQNDYMLYRIRFAESVSGLDIGSPVKFRGVQVGKVAFMSIDPADIRYIRVDISILKSAPVKTNTVASLKLQGITGSVYIELTGGRQDTPDLVSKADKDRTPDIIPEITAEPSVLNTLMDKLTHMTNQTDKLFNDRNIASINDIIRNLDQASHQINDLIQNIKENPSQLIWAPKKKPEPKS